MEMRVENALSTPQVIKLVGMDGSWGGEKDGKTSVEFLENFRPSSCLSLYMQNIRVRERDREREEKKTGAGAFI